MRVAGDTIATADGQPFLWRFATAFRLVDLVADGNEAAAIQFLDWLRGEGFTGARVLTALCCWFELGPADGQRALPRLLEMAAERGLYLEVVALAGTRDAQLTAEQMESHVAAVGAICARHPSCGAIELANENAHPSQRDELRDQAFLQRLRATIPRTVPVSMGSNCCGQPDDLVVYPGGDYVTVHTDRSGSRGDRLDRLLHVRAAANAAGVFAVDDESIGAGEREEPSRRTTDADEFFARGALARLLNIGVTFHFETGLQARVPGPRQTAAARAFIDGTKSVPDGTGVSIQDAAAAGAIVTAAGAERVYVGASGGRAIVLTVGAPGSFSIAPAQGWRREKVMRETASAGVVELVR